MKVKCELVVIGGSAGSLDVILKMLGGLEAELCLALVLVLHRKEDHLSSLSELMSVRTILEVKEAEEKEKIKPGKIYIAPAGYHLLVESDRTFSLDASEKINFTRPSIDPTMETAAHVYGNRIACLLLSGANSDGVNGLIAAKRSGGITAVQDPSTAEVSYMPQQGLIRAKVDFVIQPSEMAGFINRLSKGVL